MGNIISAERIDLSRLSDPMVIADGFDQYWEQVAYHSPGQNNLNAENEYTQWRQPLETALTAVWETLHPLQRGDVAECFRRLFRSRPIINLTQMPYFVALSDDSFQPVAYACYLHQPLAIRFLDSIDQIFRLRDNSSSQNLKLPWTVRMRQLLRPEGAWSKWAKDDCKANNLWDMKRVRFMTALDKLVRDAAEGEIWASSSLPYLQDEPHLDNPEDFTDTWDPRHPFQRDMARQARRARMGKRRNRSASPAMQNQVHNAPDPSELRFCDDPPEKPDAYAAVEAYRRDQRNYRDRDDGHQRQLGHHSKLSRMQSLGHSSLFEARLSPRQHRLYSSAEGLQRRGRNSYLGPGGGTGRRIADT